MRDVDLKERKVHLMKEEDNMAVVYLSDDAALP